MRNIVKSLVLITISLFSGLSRGGSYEDYFRAIQIDDVRTVTALLQRGLDPNTISPQGLHGLFLAVRSDSFKSASVLIDWPKTQVEWRSESDESPLMLASIKGHIDLVKQLIAKDADVNKTGWTPLHYAASGAKLQIMAILLEHHAYIDAESPNGSTPLMMAAMYANADCVKLLLESGADPTVKNQQGLTAADFASRVSRTDSLALIDAATAQWRTSTPTPTPTSTPSSPSN